MRVRPSIRRTTSRGIVRHPVRQKRRVGGDEVLGLSEVSACPQQLRDQLDSARVNSVLRLFEAHQRGRTLHADERQQSQHSKRALREYAGGNGDASLSETKLDFPQIAHLHLDTLHLGHQHPQRLLDRLELSRFKRP